MMPGLHFRLSGTKKHTNAAAHEQEHPPAFSTSTMVRSDNNHAAVQQRQDQQQQQQQEKQTQENRPHTYHGKVGPATADSNLHNLTVRQKSAHGPTSRRRRINILDIMDPPPPPPPSSSSKKSPEKQYQTVGTALEKHPSRKGKMKLLRSSSTVSDGSISSLDSWEGEEACETNTDCSDPSGHSTTHHSATAAAAASAASPDSAAVGATGEVGLQIYLMDGGGSNNDSNNNSSSTRLGYTYDAHLPKIHPNAFAPASMTHMEKLGGGGSGIAVFAGHHPELGDVVMKHGGFKDLEELFALATIAEELKRRGREAGTTPMSLSTQEAAMEMQEILPEFKFVYISPHHIEIKSKELWSRLKRIVAVGSLVGLNLAREDSRGSNNSLKSKKEKRNRSFILDGEEVFLTPGMSIRMYERAGTKLSVVLDDKSRSRKPSLAFILPQDCINFIRRSTVELINCSDYEGLQSVCRELMPIMSEHLFKFTLAQKRIGGTDAKTGNQWLYEGKLKGKVLENLMTQFIHTVQNLLELTTSEENYGIVEDIRSEIARIEETNSTCDVLSRMADDFTGSAIIKNFHPKKGRMRFLHRVCKDFNAGDIFLTPEEKIPAIHLGNLSRRDAVMSETFIGATSEPPRLPNGKRNWLNLLSRALDKRKTMSPNALKRIWTSGLADAGIHNLFVTEKDLFFFDLGEPQLQSMPGFMTKFLMSFFHTLGMEEDGTEQKWARRFVPHGNKLLLTEATRRLLAEAYDCYEIALDRLIEELFDGDSALRWLLHQYVSLQLMSDASFCLQRWETKGGGRPRDDNHNQGLERWLWRALWDIYVAFDINLESTWLRFDIEHPDFYDSVRASLDKDTLEDLESSLRFTLKGSEHGDNVITHESSPNERPKVQVQPSLRDLTLNTYFKSDANSSSGSDAEEGHISEEDDDDEDDSDDGSAIHPHVERQGSGRNHSIGLTIDS